MKTTDPLDKQIVAALTKPCTAARAAEVLALANAERHDMVSRADEVDAESLNPLATGDQARELRRQASDLRFEANRMEASVAALGARVETLKAEEAEAARKADFEAVRKVRDDLAADIAKQYPAIVRQLTSLAMRIHDSDLDCKRVGLESAEAIGRNVPANFYMVGPIHRIIARPIPLPGDRKLSWESTMSGWAWHGVQE